MGIEDINISEELQTNAPSIKYSGNEGPKSPQEMEQMIMASLEEEYAKYVFEMQEQGLEPMSMQQFIEQAMAEGQMSGGQPLPQDPTKPVNPFAPKPTGPVLPDRQMAAYGGIMGADGRKQYGIGSFFQKYIKDPIEMAVTGKTYEDLERESQARVDSEPEGYESYFDTLFKGEKGTDNQGKETRTGGLDKYVIPAIGGITAGLFTKKNQDGSPGGQPTADETALMLSDLKKSANILDQKQGLAAGLNFLPSVASRKYSPTEMIEIYKTAAANGGRIGMAGGGGIMDLGGMEKDYRNTGGFVDIGEYEKKDDVPARLSVNEFVMTADAVRGMGNGDIDLGAKRMEDLMSRMETKGKKGAQQMFDVSERLREVI